MNYNVIKDEIIKDIETDLKENKKSFRTRNWACIIYLDSAPNNFEDIIADFCVPAFLSPYHDKDINPDGSIKKPHYHLMLMFDGVKTAKQVKELFDLVNGVGCTPLNSIRGYARYLCHLDNPEKAQYNTDSVKSFGGADYLEIINLVTDKYKVLKEILNFCYANNIYQYHTLVDKCMYEKEEWFRIVADNTFFFSGYLKSKRGD